MLTEEDKSKIRNEEFFRVSVKNEIEKDENRKTKFWEKNTLNSFLDFLQKLVFAFGIPLSLYSYYDNNQKEREENQFFIYDNMDKKYWEYEVLASKYPRLGLSDVSVSDTSLNGCIKPDSLLSNEDKIVTKQMMYLLISMYERAFLMYSDGATDFRARQWDGWSNGLSRWVNNKKFLNAWFSIGVDFDKNFQDYVNSLITIENRQY